MATPDRDVHILDYFFTRDDMVRLSKNDGFTMITVATLGELIASHGERAVLKAENHRLKEHVAERNAIIESQRVEAEKQGIECSRRGSEIDYLNTVLRGSRAKQDDLQAENDRLKHEAMTSQAYARVKVFGEARTEPITGTAEELVARGFLAPVTVGNALIQPTSVRIELPGGVVVTIPQSKD